MLVASSQCAIGGLIDLQPLNRTRHLHDSFCAQLEANDRWGTLILLLSGMYVCCDARPAIYTLCLGTPLSDHGLFCYVVCV